MLGSCVLERETKEASSSLERGSIGQGQVGRECLVQHICAQSGISKQEVPLCGAREAKGQEQPAFVSRSRFPLSSPGPSFPRRTENPIINLRTPYFRNPYPAHNQRPC